MVSPDLNANMDGHLLGPAAWNFSAVSVVGETLGKLSIFKITNASPSGLAPDIPSIRILSGRLDPFPRRSSVWRPQRRALAAVGAVGSCRLKRVNSHEKAIKVTPFLVQRCDYARSSNLWLRVFEGAGWQMQTPTYPHTVNLTWNPNSIESRRLSSDWIFLISVGVIFPPYSPSRMVGFIPSGHVFVSQNSKRHKTLQNVLTVDNSKRNHMCLSYSVPCNP